MADLAPVTVQGAPEAAPAPAPALIEAEPGRVAIVDEAGAVQSVPRENADRAFEAGYRPASAAEFRGAKDGIGGKIQAGFFGAARGASFGLSDPIAIEAKRALQGDAAAEWLRGDLAEEREAHPVASAAGEIGGSLLPLMFGAPEATAAAGEGLLARAGARALTAAPRLFAEGALLGEGQQLTEDVLGNHELVAGKYLTAGLEGGLVNLMLGGALHAAGGAVVDRLATRGAGATESLAERAVGGLRGMAEEQAAKGAMPAAGIGASAMSRLGLTAEDQALRVRQVGRTLLDEGITTPLAGKALQAERLTKRVGEVGAELGAIRKGFDAASDVRPSAENIVRRIEDEIMRPLLAKPFSGSEVASVAPYIDEILGRFGKNGEKGVKSFAEVFEFRDAIDDKLAKFWKMPVEARPPGLEEVAKVRRILEQEVEAAADHAAALAGDDTATKYKVAKALFSDLKTAEGWATKASGREAQHRALSLTDTIAAGAGLASGGAIGAIAAPIANKAMRTYGNQTAAFVLDRVSKLEALQRAAVSFDAKLAASTKAFFGDGPAPAAKARRPAITPAERVALRQAAKNPGVLAEHVADMVAKTGVRDAAPNVAGAMAQSVVRAVSFVSQRLPPEPAAVGVSFGRKEPRTLGPRGQAELDRAVNALDADMMLDDFANRRLSREQVEAVKFVNPALYASMQKSVREYGAANDPSMTIQQEMALAIVFDTPVSSYTRGATIRGFQQAFAQGAPPEDPATAGGQSNQPIGSGHSKAAESMASPTDRAEANGAL